MEENKEQKKLIQEEQQILNNLIGRMDGALLQLDRKLNKQKLEIKKIKEQNLPDTYGLLIQKTEEIENMKRNIKDIQCSKSELYDHRIIVDVTDEDGRQEQEEIKIGLHSYSNGMDFFIYSWKYPVCRYYLLDNSAEKYEGLVTDKYGRKYYTKFLLKLKRRVDMRFTKVKKVGHLFPVASEEYEKIVFDEFLEELIDRRADGEFKNIVFSIQKKQGEIIMTPFEENMIVQGCAGSGKSMIMLHRLPILLYDHPDSLDRNNLYVITPSQGYIQLAKNMLYQLEISDLNMGTLKQYYDHVIQKYGKTGDEYGQIDPMIKLEADMEEYVYSLNCPEDIQNEIEQLLDLKGFNFAEAQELFELKKKVSENGTPRERLISWIAGAREIISSNNKILDEYHKGIREVLEQLERLVNALGDQKTALLRDIRKIISNEEEKIKTKFKELETMDPERNKIAYENRKSDIEKALIYKDDLSAEMMSIEADEKYFHSVNEVADKVRGILQAYQDFQKEPEKNTVQKKYQFISKIGMLIGGYYSISYDFSRIPDKYKVYASSDVLKSRFDACMKAVFILQGITKQTLSEQYAVELAETDARMQKLEKEIPALVYQEMMKGLGIEPDEKGTQAAVSCSPYLYLQVLYQYQGAPNAVKESLITIDEAQGVAPVEIDLIRKVNGDKVILNLFGDEKQHIEGTKGIDSWSALDGIVEFRRYDMLENYRNAKQVTNYCNDCFGMNMNAINVDGKGVHEFTEYTDFKQMLELLLGSKADKGRSAIIVKDTAEIDEFIHAFRLFQDKINCIKDDTIFFHETKWNLLTIDEAKGLEFTTVIAITGRMTMNEKYIAYTRALDELFVYDEKMKLEQVRVQQETDFEIEVITPSGVKEELRSEASVKTESKKTKDPEVDYTRSKVREYFEEAGLEVKDMRAKKGALWVIGPKEEIDRYIVVACRKFGITGSYSSGKVTSFKPGWYTKTKK